MLTPNFVKSDECLEMFNMAICCTRRKGKDFLVPLYFETIQIIPVSISLVQFLDCRSGVIYLTGGRELTNKKINKSSNMLHGVISV